MQTLLAIDSSAPLLQLGLLINGKFSSLSKEGKNGHGEIIFANINSLLRQNNISYDDLTNIAVIVGPGSFTGLRCGLSAALSIGFAKNIKIVGIPTLLALSLTQKNKQNFSILLDARRNQAYCQRFFAPAKPAEKEKLIEISLAKKLPNILTPKKINIEHLSRFALNLDNKNYPPIPNYVRPADAKKQTKHIIKLAEN